MKSWESTTWFRILTNSNPCLKQYFRIHFLTELFGFWRRWSGLSKRGSQNLSNWLQPRLLTRQLFFCLQIYSPWSVLRSKRTDSLAALCPGKYVDWGEVDGIAVCANIPSFHTLRDRRELELEGWSRPSDAHLLDSNIRFSHALAKRQERIPWIRMVENNNESARTDYNWNGGNNRPL